MGLFSQVLKSECSIICSWHMHLRITYKDTNFSIDGRAQSIQFGTYLV